MEEVWLLFYAKSKDSTATDLPVYTTVHSYYTSVALARSYRITQFHIRYLLSFARLLCMYTVFTIQYALTQAYLDYVALPLSCLGN